MNSKILGILILVLILSGGAFALYGATQTNEQESTDSMAMSADNSTMSEEMVSDDAMMISDGDAMGESMHDTTYTGLALTNTDAVSPLLAFTQEDYERAQANGSTILLWFYSNWCPTCAQEQKDIIEAFNTSTTPEIVGFRVNIGDNETDKDEEALAREYGVAYRHTKVVLHGSERLLKTTEVWNTARYLEKLPTFVTAE